MAVTVNWKKESGPSGEYVAYVTVGANADTLVVPLKIQGAIFRPNRIQANTDDAGANFTVGTQTLTFSLVGTTTNVSGTLIVWGTA